MRAAIYVRVSTERQAAEGLSLDAQVHRAKAYIDAQSWTLAATYIERGVSGAVPFDQRPEFQKLLARLDGHTSSDTHPARAVGAGGRIDRLVIPKLDRLGRSTKALLDIFERFETAGVGVVSLAEGIDTATPVGKLTRTILAAIAEFERDRMRERVAEVVDARAAKGEHHGGPPPLGYDYDPNGGLVVVPGEAHVVKRVFSEYVAGRSQRAIVRDLNADGITTQRGGRWYQGTLSHVVRSPLYAGYVRTNQHIHPGRHEAIIDPDTWRRASQLHSAPKARKRTKAAHLLAGGLLRCSCGGAMLAVTKPTRTPGVLYERYCCQRRIEDSGTCQVKPIRRDLIDGAIWHFFEKVALDVDATRAVLAGQHDTKLAELEALRDLAVAEAQRTRAALTRIERDYRDDKITAEQWSRLEVVLLAELEAAKAQAARLQEQRDGIVQERQTFDVETAVLDELAQLRAQAVGEVRDVGKGTDALRAALRRLFLFELLTPEKPFGTSLAAPATIPTPTTEAVPSPGSAETVVPHDDLVLDGMTILPHVRTDAVTAWWDDVTAFPALQRAALGLREFDGNGLPTPLHRLSLFLPVPLVPQPVVKRTPPTRWAEPTQNPNALLGAFQRRRSVT